MKQYKTPFFTDSVIGPVVDFYGSIPIKPVTKEQKMLNFERITENMNSELAQIHAMAIKLADAAFSAERVGKPETTDLQVSAANLSALYIKTALQVLDFFENSNEWDEDEWGADPDDNPDYDCDCDGSCGEACRCKGDSDDDEG